MTVEVRDQHGAPLADAVVYAVASGRQSPAAARQPAAATIEQKNNAFIPMVTVVQRGTSVDFPNNDAIAHDVYSLSQPKRFELKLYRGASQPVTFDTPGLVVIGCNIHDTMVAYLLVVDTPYFAKTDAAGHAELPVPPKGRYSVKAWHYGQADPEGRAEQTVETPGMDSLAFQLTTDDSQAFSL